MTGFLAMGGYAFYVWSAYALSAAVLAWMLLGAHLRHRAARAALDDMEEGR